MEITNKENGKSTLTGYPECPHGMVERHGVCIKHTDWARIPQAALQNLRSKVVGDHKKDTIVTTKEPIEIVEVKQLHTGHVDKKFADVTIEVKYGIWKDDKGVHDAHAIYGACENGKLTLFAD